ncbi:MAG TPA: protein kinase, partial [Ktedonobacteraceae bacterium]
MAIDSNELLGQVLGKCTLQHLLGQGGMGVVYLARQSRPRRTVAVKVLVPGMHTEPKERAEFLVRFRREADAIAALDHINIMPIYEYGEQEEMAYLVMPFVTGGTLRTHLAKKGILPLLEVIPIIEQAAAALDCAHAQGIVHRDLKPANILFHADGRILLADFGLAKVVRGNEDSSSSDSLSTLTSIGTIIGTPEYLSPEQSTGQPIGPYTDIYALGIVLYQMLSGHVPFTGASPVAIAIKHTMETPPPLLPLNPALSPEVEAVVMKALAKLPEERFTSAGEFAEALHAAAIGTPTASSHMHIVHNENRATSTIPDKPVLGNHAKTDASNDSTEERPFVLPLEEKSADHAQEPTEEQQSITRSDDSISKFPTKEQPSVILPEEPMLPDYQVQTHMHPERPDWYASETVEAPMPIAFETLTPPPYQASPTLAPPPVMVPSRRKQTSSVPDQQFTDKPYPTQRRGCQSMAMMLLGSLLTLVLVVGGFIVYLNLIPKSATHSTSIASATQETAKATKAQPFSPPASLVPAAGNVVYGTASPGPQCDSQGGQWSKQAGITVTCNAKGGWTQLTNTGSNTTGIFLNKLAGGKAIPDNYVIQVQVNLSATTQGQAGIFFRNQSTTPTGAGSYLINAAGAWTGNIYDNRTGAVTPLYDSAFRGNMTTAITLDVDVQGNRYTFYINGVNQGYIESGLYTGGNLGLVANGGTT